MDDWNDPTYWIVLVVFIVVWVALIVVTLKVIKHFLGDE